MLPTARRVIIRHRNPCIRRTYATQSIHEPESYSPSPPSWDNGGDERTKIPRTSLAQRTIHVRSWEGIKSMADVFTILRGIERKYGRLRDFRLIRDIDMPQMYQGVFWACFHSTESFDRVPMAGETLNIRAPDIDPTKEGGVGFYELQNLLKASDRVDDESEVPGPDIMERVLASGDPESRSEPRMLDVRVERALKESFFYPTIQCPEYSNSKKAALAHALLGWGGFATLQPMFGSKSPYNSDQEDVPVDSERMRQVLNEAARFTGRPDPSFATPSPKPTVPETMRVDEVEMFSPKPPPVRKHSRSWSLPSPPPESPPKPTKTVQSSNTKGTKATASSGATVRQQQILSKAKKAAQPAPKKQKKQVAGGTESQDRGDAQKQEWSMSKKEATNRSKGSAKPDAELKDRIWDVVGKWF